MEAPDSPPPAKQTRRFVSPRGKQSGGFAWPVVFEILYILRYCLIFIDHFVAYMHIRRGYNKYRQVSDFDPPTHQPTNTYILVQLHLQTLCTLHISTMHLFGFC